jgi:type IV pilus assembly protein PilW
MLTRSLLRLPRPLLPRLQAGMSMVELMVAMVIALIGIIIMFQVFEVSEGIKRTTSGGGDSQQNGIVGLYVIESDLRNAGMGFSDTAYAGCTILAYDVNRATPNYSLKLVPVSITAGANARTADRLTVFYGSQHMVGNSTTLTLNMTSPTSPLRVMTRYGFRPGDLMVVMEPGGAPPKDCSLMEVTSLPASPSDQINHDTGTYNLDWLGGNPSKTVRANSGIGGVTYTGANTANATRIFNIGNLYDRAGVYSVNGSSMPVYNTYSVAVTSLTVASGFSSAAAAPVADNIVHMRALYGLDDGVANGTVTYQVGPPAAGDGRIDRFVDAATFNAITPPNPPWQYVIAVRLVIVARSAQPEIGSGGPGSACDTTTAASANRPVWSGTAWQTGTAVNFLTDLDLSADANWMCYRYRTFETTVPLRNWIWKSS